MKILFILSLLSTLSFANSDTRILILSDSNFVSVENINQLEDSCYVGSKYGLQSVLSNLIEENRSDDLAITVRHENDSDSQGSVEVNIASYGCFHDGGEDCEATIQIQACN